ncbi:MAG TPA: hypothetical protein VFS62_16365 [Chloroflexota bacterium]|jgi:hypothetical protein|nr:hypothetical protein [Chloroflexota bacterium]
MANEEVLEGVWRVIEDRPDRQLPVGTPEFQPARARLAQAQALDGLRRRRAGWRVVSQPRPRFRAVPQTLPQRARAAERDFLDGLISRPLPSCPPLRSI